MLNTTVVQVASDPVWAYVMTGGVGLAGIAGTWWQASRAQKAAAKNLTTTLHADAERAKTTEKRKMYAQCMAALNSLAAAAIMHEQYRGKPLIAGRDEAFTARYAAMVQTQTAVAELKLSAPAEIGLLAGDALISLDSNHYNPTTYLQQLTQLTDAMRVDLGERPLPGKVNPLPNTNPGGADKANP